VVRTAVIVDR